VNLSLVVTAVGADKPGLVEALSEAAKAHGGNWEASRMARMAGRFAGIFLISVPTQRVDALESALAAIEGLKVLVERSDSASARPETRSLVLDLVGADHPGILQAVSSALAAREINVDELQTQVESAPMTGEPLFKLHAELSVPPSVDADELQNVLEALAADLMVELTLASE
jgi:glycine cleavage system regulatory protein